MFFPLRLLEPSARDRRDEAAAVRLRDDLGRRRRLVSWQPRDDGRWLARLSAPGLPGTIERAGRTRRQAIRRATNHLEWLLDEDR